MAARGNPSSGFVSEFSGSKAGGRPMRLRGAGQYQQRGLTNRWLNTPGGRWMTAALDPFHDRRIQVDGFPDLHAGMTTVQKVRVSFDVTRPAGVVSGPWDCHVVALPLAYKHIMVQGISQSSSGSETAVGWTTGAAQFSLGPIQAFCSVAGADTLPTTANGITIATNDFVAPSTDEFYQYHTGPSRVIAAGFEVRDSTAQVNRQGQVYITHTSNHATDTVLGIQEMTSATVVATGGRVYLGAAKELALPPSSISNLTKNPDAINWESQDGVYIPLRMESTDNPLVNRSATPIWVHETTSDGFAATGMVTLPYPIGLSTTGDYTYATNAALPCIGRHAQTIPFQTASAYFTGLHTDAKLTVTYVCWIERAPTIWQSDMIAFATPSPPYDPVAFQHYMSVVRKLPSGTKVENNDAGDWWDDALGIFSSVAGKASPFLMAVPELGPVLAGAASASATAAKAIQESGRAIQASRRAAKEAAQAKKKATTGARSNAMLVKPRK